MKYALILVAIALIGMASAVELSNSNLSLTVFKAFTQEDLVPPIVPFQPTDAAWDTSQAGKVGGFDYAEVADMTNSLAPAGLVRVGNLTNGDGHYMDGTKYFIQP